MEAAGVALAILPLIINQIDNYVQGIETLGDFRTKRYRRKLDYYATHLGSQQAVFINTLERSLEGVLEYEDGVDGFSNEEIQVLWEKPSVQSVLQTKLGRNYTPLLRTMRQLSLLLETLSRKLGWDKMPIELCPSHILTNLIVISKTAIQKSWSDSSAFNREVKKFKDIFSKGIYESILNQINAANEQLAKLMEQSDHQNRIQKKRISKRPLQRLKRNRRLAQSLHNAILKGQSWKCPCRDQHTIHFFLDISFLESTKMSTEVPNSRFRMLFASPQSIEHGGTFESSSTVLQAQMNGAFFFSQKERLTMAVNLAYGVLELHGNWLKSLWRARDIMFIRQPTNSLGHPALVLSLSNTMEISTLCRDTATSSLVQNEILFPLGLILVELSLCQPLELLRIADDYDENEANANLKTASRLLQYVESQSGPLYVEVVEQCLFWRWKTGCTLEDENIQDEIYQRIVFPLVVNLKNFVGMSSRQ
ncbi:hypothetical protein N7457_004008 [Penicillium paradoxum]|uniref:uncharacterized protein n=1 Tax=Penicillium paradoxum TaxID=176176 RepID=UPI002548B56C|nr:uncharacterized protein N7457_004008 [Penicillium paradoxum]KAJ5782234.1 hypothetical protein N7457_004008 [Penicillium paradoxum]